MDARYFLNEASLYEIEHYLNGVVEREKSKWEKAGFVAYVGARVAGADITMTDLLPFIYEEDAKPADLEKKDFDALRKRALEFQKNMEK